MKIIFSCCAKRKKNNENKSNKIQHVSPMIISASSVTSNNGEGSNIKKVNLSLSNSENEGSKISSLKRSKADVGEVQASQILGGQESLLLSPLRKGEVDLGGIQASQISPMQGNQIALQSQGSDIQKLQFSNIGSVFSIDNQPEYGWESERIVYNPSAFNDSRKTILNKDQISNELMEKINQRVKEFESKYGNRLDEFYKMLKVIVENNDIVIPYIDNQPQHAILTSLREMNYRVRCGEYKYTRVYVLNKEAKSKAKIAFDQVGLYSRVIASNINDIDISAIRGFYEDLDESRGEKNINGFDVVDNIMSYLENEKCDALKGYPSEIQLVLQHALHPNKEISQNPFVQVYFDQPIDFNSVSEVWINADGDEVKESTSDAIYQSTTGMWGLECGFGSEGVIYSDLAQTLVEYQRDKGKKVGVFNCENPKARLKEELDRYKKYKYAFDEHRNLAKSSMYF